MQNDLLNQAAAARAREQDDLNLARKLLAAASGVSMPKDGNVGRALSKIAGGPLTPGTILALKQDAAQAQRRYEHESTLDRFANNIVDEAGGATNLVTFGNVSFGDPSTLAYKAGEGIAALPIDRSARRGREPHRRGRGRASGRGRGA